MSFSYSWGGTSIEADEIRAANVSIEAAECIALKLNAMDLESLREMAGVMKVKIPSDGVEEIRSALLKANLARH